MTRVFLGIGTNLGDRERNLQDALAILSQKMVILKESSIYQTAPWGYLGQPDPDGYNCGPGRLSFAEPR